MRFHKKNRSLSPYLHHFIAVVQIILFFGAIWDKFAAKLASNFKRLKKKQHFLMVLFGTNLVSNISTRSSKGITFDAQLALFKHTNKV